MINQEREGLDPHSRALAEFGVDINDDRAVLARVRELAHKRSYNEVNALTALWESKYEQGQKEQAAA